MKSVTSFMLMFILWNASTVAQTNEIVTIVWQDGTESKLNNFKFYTGYKSVGNFYFKSTKDLSAGLFLKQENLWVVIKPDVIKSIEMKLDSEKKWFETEIELITGKKLQGMVPHTIRDTWYSGNYLWVDGKVTKFGQPGTFRVRLANLLEITTINGGKEKFLIKSKNGETKTAENLDFGLYGKMPYSSRIEINFRGSISVNSDGLNIDVPLKNIRNIEFLMKNKGKMFMRNGEEGEIILKDVTKVYGELSTGEIVFRDIYSKDGIIVKAIKF